MINNSERKSYICAINLAKGKTFGITDNSILKYMIDIQDWDIVNKIISNNPKSYMYLLKLCLKYGYITKFNFYIKHINFENTKGYIEQLASLAAKYNRRATFKFIINHYNIDFKYNMYQVIRAAIVNGFSKEITDKVSFIEIKNELRNKIQHIDALYYKSLYEGDYEIAEFIRTVENLAFNELMKTAINKQN